MMLFCMNLLLIKFKGPGGDAEREEESPNMLDTRELVAFSLIEASSILQILVGVRY